MGNIPLQNGGQFIQAEQKRGVSADWGNQAFEYAKSITESFNKAGQAVGNSLIKMGKFVGSYGQAQDDRQNQMDDAYSISALKIKSGEQFSGFEKTIAEKDYESVEQFDKDWETTYQPELDSAFDSTMSDPKVVINRPRLEQQSQNWYRLQKEQFRRKQREAVALKVGEKRKANAAQAISNAGASANIEAVQTSYDMAISAGIPQAEAYEMARGALFEAFSVTQRRASEAHGANSVQYKIAMHTALSGERDAISGKIFQIFNDEDDKVFKAWKDGNFSEVLSVPAKKKKSSSAGTRTTVAASGKGDATETPSGKIATDTEWDAAIKAGIEDATKAKDEALKNIDEAKKNGIVDDATANALKAEAENDFAQAHAQVYDTVALAKKSAQKEQCDIVKSLIAAGQVREQVQEQVNRITYRDRTSQGVTDNLQWMAKAPNSADIDAKKSALTLLKIYREAGRFNDTDDPGGEGRLAAFALAFKNCNDHDYDQALQVLKGGTGDAAAQESVRYGIAKLFEAAGLDEADIDKKHKDMDDRVGARLASLCHKLVNLAGTLPEQSFEALVDSCCTEIQRCQGEETRVRYLNGFIADATRSIESLSRQKSAAETPDIYSSEAAKVLAEESAEKAAEKAARPPRASDDSPQAKRFSRPPPPVITPGTIVF